MVGLLFVCSFVYDRVIREYEIRAAQIAKNFFPKLDTWCNVFYVENFGDPSAPTGFPGNIDF